MTISAYSTTAALNTSINGVSIAELCPAGNLNDAIRQLMADIASFVAGSSFPTGTVMPFAQSAAPTGWTKILTHDNTALRVVSGAAGIGGTVAFTSIFNGAGITTGAHALSVNELPAHHHFAFNGDSGNGALGSDNYPTGAATGLSNASYTIQGDATAPSIGLTSDTGGSAGHSHTLPLNLDVRYVDVILARKA